MSKICTVIIEGTFKKGMENSPEFSEYSRQSNENGEKHGGVVIHKVIVSENLGSGQTPNFVLFIEYPTREKAIETFTNDEYLKLGELRNQIFESVKILIEK